MRRISRPTCFVGTALSAASVAIALAAWVFVSPVGAIGVSGGTMPFGLTPAPDGDGQAPSYFDLNAAAGQRVAEVVVLSNQGSRDQTLKLSPSTGVTSPNSGSAFYGYFQPCVGTGCWISGIPSTITLAAGASQRVPFTVVIPSGMTPKQYLAGITAEPKTPPPPVIVGSNGKASARATIVSQVTVGVAVTVGAISQLKTSLHVPAVTAGSVGSMPRLFVHVDNAGQTFAKGNGTVTCTGADRELSYPIVVDTVLPGEAASVPVNAPGLGFDAPIRCAVHLKYGLGLVAAWSGTVLVATTTATTIVHTGPGVYSSLPVGGIPGWGLALIVIGALVLVALIVLVVLLLRRHRSEARADPDPDPDHGAAVAAAAPEHAEGNAPEPSKREG
jgi:uncharacterized membrane protein